MTKSSAKFVRSGFFSTMIAGVLAFAFVAQADTPKRDIEFASGLVELGFPDFADKVVKQVLFKNPGMEPETQIVQAQILISKRKFDDAKAILESLGANDPKAQAIELALAGAYYNIGRLDDARVIYNRFFKLYRKKAPSDPVLLKFYRDSAYTFGQMLEAAGDYKGAADSYNKILQSNPPADLKRRLQAECAKLYLMSAQDMVGVARTQVLDAAERICTDLQWGGIDIWFGHSISTMAHIQLMRGDPNRAQQTLEEYMQMLKQIDEVLKEQDMLRESPMAEARFMLGELYEQRAEKLAKGKKDQEAIAMYGKALGEFYNVFVKYGDSDFGPKSGLRADALIGLLESKYDKKIDIQIDPKNKARAAKQAFKMADNLFRNQDYKAAIPEYMQMIQRYPENPQSVGALVNLAQSYAHEKDDLMVKVTINYLGERFHDEDMAALGLLATGKVYFDRKNEGMYTYIYDKYVDYFPKHEKAGLILYTLAGFFKEQGDTEKAAKYYDRLVKEYPTDRNSIKALSQIAWTEYANKNYEAAIPGFISYLSTVQPGYDKAKAQFCLSDCYMKVDQYVKALKSFNKLVGWLAPKDSPYNNSAEAANKNKDLLEKANFYRGYCCTQVKNPKKLVVPLRKKAIKFFADFIEEYPKSTLAPQAMQRMGGTQLELNQFDAAVKTFNELADKYPNSPEGENARFSLIRAAMEVEKFDIARDALREMLAKKSAYSVDDFARIGQMMMEAELYPETIQAFAEVQGKTEERSLLERALYGTGKAYYEQKNYPQAIATFEELMERYPNSGLFYDAKFVLGNSYRETGDADKAIEVLSDVFKYSDSPVLVNEANMILGQVQLQQEDVDAALASFGRVILLAEHTKELKPIIEKCLLLAIPVSMKDGRYQDVQDYCDQYEDMFPTSSKVGQIRSIKKDAKRKAASAE